MRRDKFLIKQQTAFQPDSARKRSHNLHETYQLPCVQQITPDDGHRRCPKHVEFHDKINFGYLMHLVGCFIRKIPLFCWFSWWLFCFEEHEYRFNRACKSRYEAVETISAVSLYSSLGCSVSQSSSRRHRNSPVSNIDLVKGDKLLVKSVPNICKSVMLRYYLQLRISSLSVHSYYSFSHSTHFTL